VKFFCTKNDKGKRIDRIMRALFPYVPLSAIGKAIRNGKIILDGKKASFSNRVNYNSVIDCHAVFAHEARKALQKSYKAPATILFEDAHIAALYKPWDLTISGKFIQDIQSFFMHVPDLSFRPSPAHRLDRNTSGLLLISKTIDAARILAFCFKNRKIEKTYLAILDKIVSKPCIWNYRLIRKNRKTYPSPEGKDAITMVTPLAYGAKQTFALLRITTGRTHQIRAHAAAYGHSLSGDIKYGGIKNSWGYFLHSYSIAFKRSCRISQQHLKAPLCSQQLYRIQNIWNDPKKKLKLSTLI